jgi:hypothetical protein
MEGKRQRPDDPDAGMVDERKNARERIGSVEADAAPTSDKAQDAAVDTEDRQNEREAARSENGKSRGNGDDAIEDGSLSGRPPAGQTKTSDC